jgi:hypothetical protein
MLGRPAATALILLGAPGRCAGRVRRRVRRPDGHGSTDVTSGPDDDETATGGEVNHGANVVVSGHGTFKRQAVRGRRRGNATAWVTTTVCLS